MFSSLPFAIEIAIRAGLPNHWCRIDDTLSAEIHALERTSPFKAIRRRRRYRRLYRSRRLVAVSDGVAADLVEYFDVPRHNIARIYNPFDFEAIRARAAEPLALPAYPYVIHVGRFNAQKRHDVLLDAWQKVGGPHRLVLLTRSEPALVEMIEARRLSDRVMIAGFQSNPYPWINTRS